MMTKAPVRRKVGPATFIAIAATCCLIWLYFPTEGPLLRWGISSTETEPHGLGLDGYRKHETPYDQNLFPFTDFSKSRKKTGYPFWASMKPGYKCPPRLKYLVGQGDALSFGKWMCGLETLGRLNVQEDYKCNLYSFGVGGDSSFEAVVLHTTTCSVYAYDPTVKKIAVPLRASNPRLRFQKLGIGGKNKTSIRTLKMFMDENGHKFAEILKMDVEGAEYESFERLLKDFNNELPFGQLLIEVHNWDRTLAGFQRIIDFLKTLERLGARIFSIETNGDRCAEIALINLKYRSLFVPEQNL